MPESERCPKGRSQMLTSGSTGKIVIDQNTFTQLQTLVSHCEEGIEYSRSNDIFLKSLEIYLSTEEKPQAHQAVILLKVWRDTVPEALTEVAGWIGEALELTKTILAASQLGGSDE